MTSDRLEKLLSKRPHLRTKAQEVVQCDDAQKRSGLVADLLEMTEEKVDSGKRERAQVDSGKVNAKFEVQSVLPRGKHLLSFTATEVYLSASARPEEIVAEAGSPAIDFLALLRTPSTTTLVVLVLKEETQIGRSTSRFIVMNSEADTPVKDLLGETEYSSLSVAVAEKLKELSAVDVCETKLSDFQSSAGKPAVECRVKAAQGFLFPTARGVFFGPQKFTFFARESIKRTSFGEEGVNTFDLTLQTAAGEKVEFSGIDRMEHAQIRKYISRFKIDGPSGSNGMEQAGGSRASKGSSTRSSKDAAGASGSRRSQAGFLSADLPSEDESDDGNYDPDDEESSGKEASDDNVLEDVVRENNDSDDS